MLSSITRFLRDEEGATAIEYGIIAGLISIAIVTVLRSHSARSSKPSFHDNFDRSCWRSHPKQSVRRHTWHALLCFGCFVTVYDFRQRRVPNWLVLAGAAVALAALAFGVQPFGVAWSSALLGRRCRLCLPAVFLCHPSHGGRRREVRRCPRTVGRPFRPGTDLDRRQPRGRRAQRCCGSPCGAGPFPLGSLSSCRAPLLQPTAALRRTGLASFPMRLTSPWPPWCGWLGGDRVSRSLPLSPQAFHFSVSMIACLQPSACRP
jgi:hypothetical protein